MLAEENPQLPSWILDADLFIPSARAKTPQSKHRRHRRSARDNDASLQAVTTLLDPAATPRDPAAFSAASENTSTPEQAAMDSLKAFKVSPPYAVLRARLHSHFPLVPLHQLDTILTNFAETLQDCIQSLPDVKIHTIPAHASSSIQNIRPLANEAIKDAKPSSLISPTMDYTAPVTYPGEQEMGLQDREWFAGICGRKTAEDTLQKVKKDGSFMVRCSTAQNARQPFTLVVLFNQKVYNIPVRFLKDSSSYALGKEGKKCDELFGSLQEMITHHKDNPLLLIDSKRQAKHTTYLTHPVHL